jgi:hypothetical protein
LFGVLLLWPVVIIMTLPFPYCPTNAWVCRLVAFLEVIIIDVGDMGMGIDGMAIPNPFAMLEEGDNGDIPPQLLEEGECRPPPMPAPPNPVPPILEYDR